MGKYKVLVVGVGNMGSAHAKAYNDIEEFDLVGLVARTNKRRSPLSKSLGGIREFDDLPKNAKTYIKELEKFIEAKISSISTSPERNDTILIVDPFKI